MAGLKNKKTQKQVDTKDKSKEPPKNPCGLCLKGHPLRRCPCFLAMKPAQRIVVAKAHGYCINCLANSHQLKNCTSENVCMTCGDSHHSLLHNGEQEKQNPTKPQSKTKTSTKTNSTYHRSSSESGRYSSRSQSRSSLPTSMPRSTSRFGPMSRSSYSNSFLPSSSNTNAIWSGSSSYSNSFEPPNSNTNLAWPSSSSSYSNSFQTSSSNANPSWNTNNYLKRAAEETPQMLYSRDREEIPFHLTTKWRLVEDALKALGRLNEAL